MTFSETSQWVDVDRFANYDYVVCDVTTMTITCATFSPVVGNQIVGTLGQIGYLYAINGGGFDVANVTSTLFGAGTDYYVENGGATYSATVSSVTVTFGPQNAPLQDLVDRDKYLKTTLETHIGSCVATAHPLVATLSNYGFVAPQMLQPFRNKIINGGFNIWQRGTTISTNTYTYAGDRWFTDIDQQVSGSINVSLSSMVTAIGTVSSSRISMVVGASLLAAGAHIHGHQQVIENLNCVDLVGHTISVSFDFKSNTIGTFSVALRNGYSTHSYITDFNYTTVSTVQHVQKSIFIPPTITMNTSLQYTSTVGLSLVIGFDGVSLYNSATLNQWLTGNYSASQASIPWTRTTGNYVELANVQLTKGEFEQPFEIVPFDIELQRCQRYYETGYYEFHGYQVVNNGMAYTVNFHVQKRRIATVSWVEIEGSLAAIQYVVSRTPHEVFIYYIKHTTSGPSYWSGYWYADAELY